MAGLAIIAGAPAVTGFAARQAPAGAPVPLVLPQEKHLATVN